ncbi:hypothetical protein PG991_002024 [Apiospora marii]|uniref:Serine/threonine-protein kinase ppk6 n=1 Tax=Apiospora marii TaxID=335849 RepID=A0ABR1SNP1_9PEZI
MSADLFAEFVETPPPASQTPQPAKPSSDPFDFSSFTTNRQTASAPPPQQNQPWPAFQSTPDPWATFATSTTTAPVPLGTNTAGNNIDDDDDDEGWGDFEVAENTRSTSISNAPPPVPAANAPKPSPSPDTVARTRIVRAPTIDLLSNSLIDIPGRNNNNQSRKAPTAQQPKPKPKLETISQKKSTRNPPKPDPNVLFDADDFGGDNEDDDDFGDFESFSTPPPAPAATRNVQPKESASQLLATLSLQEPASNYPQAPKSPSFQERNPFPGLALKKPTPAPAASKDDPITSPITAWPTLDKMNSAGSNTMDDGWGDWDSFDRSKPVTKPTPKPASRKPASKPVSKPTSKKPEKVNTVSQDTAADWGWDDADPIIDDAKDDGFQIPPSNIPPPSVLLSIFPQLLGMANTSLYKPVGGQPFSIKNRVMSDPRTLEFLKGYLSLATVGARIIAGRKQRWHRDKFLAQSMSISAAGSKGMKLAGIDKTQAAREDREAGDILDVWKEHVGRLRSAIATANSALKDQHLKIPELRDNMQVQTAKGVPTSSKACIICGLRRDERVARVDIEVEDSFGEWWAEHWGHVACKRFWLKHENALRQR